MADIALTSLLFLFDIVRGAFALWHRPLSFVLFLWLTSLLNTPLLWVASLALKPLCGIPGVDRSHFCITENTASHVNYPCLIEAQTLTFEKLLDNTVGGSGLSLEIKKAKLAVVELVTLVEYSQLTNQYVLVDSLTLFVQDARSSGRGLQLLSLKVYGAVDLIIAINKCTMNMLSSISSPSSSIFSWALTPFYSRPSITHEVIREAFVDSMITLAGLVENLILLAEVELMNIDRLEEHLSLLHVLTVQEDTAISSAKTELLRDIWTLFGGNRRMLKGYDKNLELLHGIGGVWRQAWAHVTSVLRQRQRCPSLRIAQITSKPMVSFLQN
ncbi:hypothetical protein BDP27DRAFT_1242502 [Rhodocollybia butyracea]|uniref:Uncharacterized protein n=1 Tax=Rhodocollybia butyracea TaxID=206335 RepID=A0A9P5P3A1_9AGAR|nr:hypothetical protein BDP27DRAFT_1242502 [Rhodocollybia butyracea]